MNRVLALLLFAGICALVFPLNAQDKPGIVKSFESAQKKAAKKTVKKVALSEHVKLELKTSPKVRASVRYGRKRLGYTPLKTKLKRDSGPVDIVIEAEGYITLNTRIFTNADTKITVKLTKEEDANTLYGYKEKIPPDAGVLPPDAGFAPAPSGTAPGTSPSSGVSPITPPTPTPIKVP